MEKILLLGIVFAAFLFVGAVGSVLAVGSDFGFMNGHHHMMHDGDRDHMNEDCEEYMGEECDLDSHEDCEEEHEECEEYMENNCWHEDFGC